MKSQLLDIRFSLAQIARTMWLGLQLSLIARWWISPWASIWQLVLVSYGKRDTEEIRRERRILRSLLRRLRKSIKSLDGRRTLQSSVAIRLQSQGLRVVLSKTLAVECSSADLLLLVSRFSSQSEVLKSYLELCGADAGLATFESVRRQWKQFIFVVMLSDEHSRERQLRNFVRDTFRMQRHFNGQQREVELQLSGISGRYSMAISAIAQVMEYPFRQGVELRTVAIWNSLRKCESCAQERMIEKRL